MNIDIDGNLNHQPEPRLDFTRFVVEHVPPSHRELADQLLRAAQSQPLNIAEGAGRRSVADQNRFYIHARGSATESAGALDTMRTMKLIDDEHHERGIELLEDIVGGLNATTNSRNSSERW